MCKNPNNILATFECNSNLRYFYYHKKQETIFVLLSTVILRVALCACKCSTLLWRKKIHRRSSETKFAWNYSGIKLNGGCHTTRNFVTARLHASWSVVKPQRLWRTAYVDREGKINVQTEFWWGNPLKNGHWYNQEVDGSHGTRLCGTGSGSCAVAGLLCDW